MRNFRFIFIGLLVVVGLALLLKNKNGGFEEGTIEIQDKEVSVFVVRTEKERAQGLMNVEDLGEQRGMLFAFEDSAVRAFWNKDTFISLGIIWIEDSLIIGTSSLPNVQSNGNFQVVSPGEVDRVLELSVSDELFLNSRIGDYIKF